MAEQRSEIAFFDVETTLPTESAPGRTMLEFGAILVCPKKLVELENYSTLICPKDISLMSIFDRRNGITRAALASAPFFSSIADEIFDLLNGRIWAGHNILRFDCIRIREAFAEIGRSPPEPKWIIDSLDLLTERFGPRAGNMKMATLATYFRLGPQTHRSLDDARMNLEVLRHCATVLFWESSLPDSLASASASASSSTFLTPEDVNIDSISASLGPFYGGSRRIQILHGTGTAAVLKLHCTNLEVRFGIRNKFVDQAGRPKLSFVVDAPPTLCDVLEACDVHAHSLFMQSGSTSVWRPLIVEYGYWNLPTIRLHIPTVVTGDIATYRTEIFQREASSGGEQKLDFSNFDAEELENLFTAGSFIDALFSLDTFDYQRQAGIRLVTEKLVIHSM